MAATKAAIDMTNVKEQSNVRPKRKPEGDYRAKVLSVDDHTSGAGNKGWQFVIQLTTDSRATYPYHCQHDEKFAWKIRNLAMACGKAVPKKKVMVDPNAFVGKEIGIALEDDEYEGKPKSQIIAVFPVSELTADSPASASRSSGKSRGSSSSDSDDTDDVDDADDVDESGDDDLDLEEL